ncbi:MAG: hypothetical protein C9356_01585 [Oleiphilus sp.]|nr:MAG: hypothetical protein C9356_01585 [Oleiphilus sp.]
MTSRKTQETEESVDEFVTSISDSNKREDCRALVDLFSTATKQVPKMWGAQIVGFGKRHYTYANGKPAEICKVGFAPRSRSFAFYLGDFPGRSELLADLGKHRFSGECLHIARLSHVNLRVLKKIIQSSYHI